MFVGSGREDVVERSERRERRERTKGGRERREWANRRTRKGEIGR